MDAELHYLTYDPEAMFAEMVVAYMDAGGKPLYAGDEKEMLLRGTMAIFMQTYAAFDHAARMQTLRYATGDYLDMIGEKRGIARIDAVKATGKISILVQRSISPIPAGTLFTDGARTYATLTEVSVPAGTGTLAIEAAIECTQAGSAGNAMMQGMALYQVEQNAKVLSVTVTQTTMGGVDAEEDEAYRERIREGGFYGATTGPKGAYESKAMEVSASIVDAGAYRVSNEVGAVGIALILADGLSASEIAVIKNSVQQAFTKVEIGDGTKSTGFESTTQLVHFLYTLTLQSVLRSGQKVTVTSEVANSGLTLGYYLREAALYAKLGTEAEAIFAYDNAGDGAIFIPAGSSNVSMDGRLRFAFQIDEASSVTINTAGLQFAEYDHRHDNATSSADGFMPAADKQKLDDRLGQAVNTNSSPTFAGATIGGILIDANGVAHGLKYEA